MLRRLARTAQGTENRRPCPLSRGQAFPENAQGGQVTLYSYFRSSAAYRVRIAFNLKGLSYDTVAVHLQKEGGQHRKPDYRAVNPQMRLPALKLELGRGPHAVARHHRISRRGPSAAAAAAARERRARPGAGPGPAGGLRHSSAQQSGAAALPQERARPGPRQDRRLVSPLGAGGLRRVRGDGRPGPLFAAGPMSRLRMFVWCRRSPMRGA